MNTFESSREPKQELAPGFSETRRRILWLPLSLGAALTLQRRSGFVANALAAEPDEARPGAGDQLDWPTFLNQCVPKAEDLHKDSSAPGQEAYLHWIASMIMRTRTADIPRAKVGRFGKLEPAVNFGMAYRGKPFFIVEWQLEPNASLPPHCHPNASVCTVGLDGEARIRNFEVVGQAPEFTSRKSFLVRETHNEIISQGRINTLSSLRDNIHTFHAGKSGAQGIDISTYHGPDVGFSFLDLSATPKESDRRIFEAAWKGQSV